MSKGIDYGLDLDTSGFTGGISAARASLGGFQAFSVGAMAAVGAAVAGAALALKGLQTVWTEAQAAVGEAANRETMQTAFIPLLGSAKAAKDRMAELADFAAHTPFQLPEVAAASRTLETLTNGVLSTGQGLTMIGDVASGTNTPFEELAVTIGRLYSGLDSGRPVGEAMQRLQEIGAITPGVRAKLEKLQAEGEKGSEVWRVAAEDLARFSGGWNCKAKLGMASCPPSVMPGPRYVPNSGSRLWTPSSPCLTMASERLKAWPPRHAKSAKRLLMPCGLWSNRLSRGSLEPGKTGVDPGISGEREFPVAGADGSL